MPKEELSVPEILYPIVKKDGRMTPQFHDFLVDLVAQVKASSVVLVSGTPEGATIAETGALASNVDAAPGTGLFAKESGAGDTGWVARS